VAEKTGSFGLAHQVQERGKHLSAATCFQVLNESTRSSEIVGCCG
jgi:hypothetical protein